MSLKMLYKQTTMTEQNEDELIPKLRFQKFRNAGEWEGGVLSGAGIDLLQKKGLY